MCETNYSKFLEKEKCNDFNFMYDYLYINTNLKLCAFKEKKFNLRFYQNKKEILDDNAYKWLLFNDTSIKFIIIDIDFKECSLNDFYEKLEKKPTWLLETKKGFHVCYALKSAIKMANFKAILWAKNIKEALTLELKGDIQGSHRLNGIWRNPLAHNFLGSLEEYELKDFNFLVVKHNKTQKTPTQKFKSDLQNRKIQSNNFKYEKKNRNNFIFVESMVRSFGKNLTLEETKKMVFEISKDFSKIYKIEEIEKCELLATSKSVFKYNQNGKNFLGENFGKNEKEKNRGVLGFEKMKDLTLEEYKIEVKKRQSEGGNFTKNIKGIQMTRKENIKKVTKKIEEDNFEKLKNFLNGNLFIEEYKKPSGKWNITKLANVLQLSRPTIYKGLKQIKTF